MIKKNKENNIEKDNVWIWIIIAIVTVFVIFTGCWLMIRFWHPIPSTAAEFGDSFGAANALFSALAFAFLIVTVLMQKKELKLQRKELKDTRLEFKTNRITTIMFKQLDYLNSIIGKSIFVIKNDLSGENSKNKIEEFVRSVDEHYFAKKTHLIEKLIDENDIVIRVTAQKIVSVLDGLNNLFQSYNLDNIESQQMRKIFKMNITPSFLKLLFYRSHYAKKEFSEDPEIQRLEKIIIESHEKQYQRILNFGKDEAEILNSIND